MIMLKQYAFSLQTIPLMSQDLFPGHLGIFKAATIVVQEQRYTTTQIDVRSFSAISKLPHSSWKAV